MAKLNTHIHIDGQWYGPNDTLPEDVAARITNPDVWDGDAPERPYTAVATKSEVDSGQAENRAKQPPRKGPGSGGPAWIEFAKDNGVTQTFDSKDALIGHLEDEGIIEKE